VIWTLCLDREQALNEGLADINSGVGPVDISLKIAIVLRPKTRQQPAGANLRPSGRCLPMHSLITTAHVSVSITLRLANLRVYKDTLRKPSCCCRIKCHDPCPETASIVSFTPLATG
jgi:hypothetical protein